MRSRSFTDPTNYRYSQSKTCNKAAEAKPIIAAHFENCKQTKLTNPPQEQQDDWITVTTTKTLSSNIKACSLDSFTGAAIGQACSDQPGETESAFDQLRAMKECRQYMLQRFLTDEDHPSIRVLDEHPRRSSCAEDIVSDFDANHLPAGRRTSLDSNLLVIGAFAADFHEYSSSYSPIYIFKANNWHKSKI